MTAHQATRERRRQRGLVDERKRCSRCDSPNDRAPQRYCKACHAFTMRKWRSEHRYVSRETVCFTKEGPK